MCSDAFSHIGCTWAEAGLGTFDIVQFSTVTIVRTLCTLISD